MRTRRSAPTRAMGAGARSKTMLACLNLPKAFSVADVCVAVAEVTGRRVELHPLAPGWGPAGVSGAWVGAEDVDHIVFTDDGSTIGKATTIVHECGHVLFSETFAAGTDEVVNDDVASLRPVASLVGASVVGARVRGRTSFSADEEATVETFAALVVNAGMLGLLDRPKHAGDRLVDRFG